MLVAAPVSHSDSLDLFRLALSMVEEDREAIPGNLKDYLSDVLKEAQDIARDPNKITNSTMPEAIELAAEICSFKDFSQEIEAIQNTADLSPDLAKKILEALEANPVYQNGFSSFEGLSL